VDVSFGTGQVDVATRLDVVLLGNVALAALLVAATAKTNACFCFSN